MNVPFQILLSGLFASCLLLASCQTTPTTNAQDQPQTPVATTLKQVPSLESLQGDAVLTVTHSTLGCFGEGTSQTFRFTRSGTGIVVDITRLTLTGSKSQPSAAPSPHGRLALSKTDVKRLDNLFRYYRTLKPGDCTFIHQVRLIWKASCAVQFNQMYEDSTCQPLAKRRDLLDLSTLASRLPKPTP